LKPYCDVIKPKTEDSTGFYDIFFALGCTNCLPINIIALTLFINPKSEKYLIFAVKFGIVKLDNLVKLQAEPCCVRKENKN